jgi:hypothetical protein
MSLEERKTFQQRAPKILDCGPFQPLLDSFELHLAAEKKKPKTIRTYIEAAQWLAGAHLLPGPDEQTGLGCAKTGWDQVIADDIRVWIVALLGSYSDSEREREGHAYAAKAQLWLGIKNRPSMTASGIYQMVARRGDEAGVGQPAQVPAQLLPHLARQGRSRGRPQGAQRLELGPDAAPLRCQRQGSPCPPQLRPNHGHIAATADRRMSPIGCRQVPMWGQGARRPGVNRLLPAPDAVPARLGVRAGLPLRPLDFGMP